MKCLSFLGMCMWSWVALSMGCLERDRNALLEIKAAFNYPNESSLPSWHNGNSDCCTWDGVRCDDTTLLVTRLFLNHKRDWNLEVPWAIHASLFLPLEELRVLDLSGNYLKGRSLSFYTRTHAHTHTT